MGFSRANSDKRHWDWNQALDDVIDDAGVYADVDTNEVPLDVVIELLKRYTQEQRDLMLAGWIVTDVSATPFEEE